ncbi:MAG: DinB family protein [Bacteroidota bacterium]
MLPSNLIFFSSLSREVKRRLVDESIPRIRQCLHILTEADIWYRPNENSNSVGNLVLHLCGNVRQWLVSGLSRTPDTRERDLEFSERGPWPTKDLLAQLDQLEQEILQTLASLGPEDLIRDYEVQGFQENGIGILVHVIEHFSYHTGQITYFTKAHKDVDTGYYADHDL